MIEVAMVFDDRGRTIHWHTPEGSSSGSIQDSPSLWEILWDNRDTLGGVAHTHPGSGLPSPSHTDVTTFAAVERGLGKNLIWPIVTLDHALYYLFEKQTKEYLPISAKPTFTLEGRWTDALYKLRRLSQYGG